MSDDISDDIFVSDDPKPLVPHGGDAPLVRRPGMVFAWVLKWLSGVLILLCAAASLWFFAGFADNDGGFWHLLSAAGLCFGVAALFIGPLWAGMRMTGAFLKNGRTVVRAKWVFILFLPWLPLGVYTVVLGGRWTILGGVILAVAILYLLWAVTLLARKK